MSTLTATELAHRVRLQGLRIGKGTAQMFLAFWITEEIVREVAPGEYELTAKGLRVAAGLLDVGRDERAA
jgi:hypothetical protein